MEAFTKAKLPLPFNKIFRFFETAPIFRRRFGASERAASPRSESCAAFASVWTSRLFRFEAAEEGGFCEIGKLFTDFARILDCVALPLHFYFITFQYTTNLNI